MPLKINEVESKPPQKEGKGRLSDGWIVALAGGVCILAVSNFQYAFGVFLKPLIDQFGWSRAAISGCVTIRSVISGIMSPISGDLSDRYGPKKLIFVGILAVGLSYLLASNLSSLLGLYLILGVLTGLGTGCCSTPIIATVTKWFGGRAGLANGIVMSGFSVAQIIVPLIVTYLILQYSWATCFILMGLAVPVVGITSWSFIKTPPQGVSSPNPGASPPEASSPEASSPETSPPEASHGAGNVSKADEGTPATDQYSLSEALHIPALWILLIIYFIVALCYQMVIIHIVAAAVDEGATLEAAAIILTLSGITSTLGRLTSGGLASKVGSKIVLAFCLVIQAPALFFLAGASSLHLFYLLCSVYGFSYAGTTPIVPTIAASLFGTKSVGSIYGIINLGYTTGVAIGPLFAGYIFDVTGSYSVAFLSAAAAIVVSFLLCLALKRPEAKALAA
jgi:MFS family permease